MRQVQVLRQETAIGAWPGDCTWRVEGTIGDETLILLDSSGAELARYPHGTWESVQRVNVQD